ncbi:MAG: hypothetical protein EHM23_28675 [Acidobacteria bacterium]|nr:MAG: hypothetical protein EHM23_28675 [Acidobacteriota bacterium]
MRQKVSVFPSSGQAEIQTKDPADPSSGSESIELLKVLQSRTFARSPRLSRILDYVCRKYFAGQTDQLKEYTIAVELFGRSEGFQPRDDSSIRVDMNRLRKQLRKYYRAEGKQDPLVISIPSGQYAPVFSRREPKPTTGDLPLAADLTSSKPLHPRRWWIVGVLGVGLLAAVGGLFFLGWSGRGPVGTVAIPAPSLPGNAVRVAQSPPPGPEVRILSGVSRDRSIDPFGNVWLGDRYFTGGSSVKSPAGLPLIFRYGITAEGSYAREGDFTYHIPLQPGVYELRLYFMEWMYGSGDGAGGENYRIFDVFINGNLLLSRFDIVTDAGGVRVPDVKVFTDISPASDGLLHMKFVSRQSKAILSGIEILPGLPGKIRPVRVACRSTPYTGPDGAVWSADRFFRGGRLAERHAPISGTPDTALYQSERYGHFSYTIPVTNHGLYTVVLGFAETYFGAGNPGEGSKSERLFNVLCNGQILLKDFSIVQASGGANRALIRAFEHIEPSPQGKMVLDFVPVRDYACINTIQVVSE